jgi:transposase
MTGDRSVQVLTDAQWAALEPLIDEVRPPCKVPHDDLRQTIEAIFWRHQNGAKWRSIPAALGPWWQAAQTFIRWAKLGVWERLLELAHQRQRGVALGMAFIDGSSIRAHPKAAGAEKRGPTAQGAISVRRLAARAAATAPRPA